MRPTAILQIRTGSTRLPGKMLMPFYGEDSIPSLLIKLLANIFDKDHLIVATTLSPADDAIEQLAEKLEVSCFRGSEDDVLGRFLGAIGQFEADPVIRICADNPFLRLEYILELMHAFEGEEYEYISYMFPDGTPVMKSHIGLFAEIMSAAFLKKIDSFTKEALYREHVTNYVYDHREAFNALFLPVPELLAERRDIRLTIDTAADFQLSSGLYSELCSNRRGFTVAELVEAIDAHPAILEQMKTEITRNSK